MKHHNIDMTGLPDTSTRWVKEPGTLCACGRTYQRWYDKGQPTDIVYCTRCRVQTILKKVETTIDLLTELVGEGARRV